MSLWIKVIFHSHLAWLRSTMVTTSDSEFEGWEFKPALSNLSNTGRKAKLHRLLKPALRG